MENMSIWEQVARPPQEALKLINGGRLAGKTNIDPQWRLKVMTELFGPVGLGWKYLTVEHWSETLGNETACFVRIELFIKQDDKWSEPIEGIGGSKLLVKERKGLFLSDEAYKMATTDALSVAMKQLGVAADVYLGLFDGSKYSTPHQPAQQIVVPPLKDISETSRALLAELYKKVGNKYTKYQFTQAVYTALGKWPETEAEIESLKL